MTDKHIEAAAEAVSAVTFRPGWAAIEVAQAAITAYCESLASAGDEGLHAAARDAYVRATVNGGDFDAGLRAALAVARLSMGEDTARLDWMADNSKCYWVEVQSQPRGEYVYRGGGYGLRDALDEVMSAARANEAASNE